MIELMLALYFLVQVVGLVITATNIDDLKHSFDNGVSIAHILFIVIMLPAIILALLAYIITIVVEFTWKQVKRLHEIKVIKWN